MKRYMRHLMKNWKVAAHALKDAVAHFTLGIVPIIKIKHHQPTDN